jgi:hypothetical protein
VPAELRFKNNYNASLAWSFILSTKFIKTVFSSSCELPFNHFSTRRFEIYVHYTHQKHVDVVPFRL